MARYYLSYAKYSGKILSSLAALIAAFFCQPGVVKKRGYLTTWLKVLGMMPVLKWPRERLKAS
jgi:hypothetical protein